jgi:hypothetical protein
VRGIFSAIGSLITIAIVVVVVLVGLAFVGTPSASCADGAIPVSKAAEDSFKTKWNAFDATVSKGTAATVTFSEEDIT